MHYIRLLRPPKFSGSAGNSQVELLFTITTDLGDAFLLIDEPIQIVVSAAVTSKNGETLKPVSEKGPILWRPHMRVCKHNLKIPKAVQSASKTADMLQLKLSAVLGRSATGVRSILTAAAGKMKGEDIEGLIMPLWTSINTPGLNNDATSRRIMLGRATEKTDYLEIQEDIGESIARHVWDAGVVALCGIIGTHSLPNLDVTRNPCLKLVNMLLTSEGDLNILELGCGVGILSMGIAAALPRMRSDLGKGSTIVMTDLQEAEEWVMRNIHNFNRRYPESEVQLRYENLDWEDGRKGQFGDLVGSRRWDLIILSDCTYNIDVAPALIGTLSALHISNVAQHRTRREDSNGSVTNVFLAMKPRHESEKPFFAMMKKEGWRKTLDQAVLVPKLGADDEQVELYLFKKA